MQDLNEKRTIEAALFISGRPVSLQELRTLTGIAALGYLQGKIIELQKEYEERGSSLEILEEMGKYEMRVKNQYLAKVKQFAQDMQVSKTALRTLAYISKHDGILKSELARKIGPQIYQDVQELLDNEFITTKKAGRTMKVNLTDKFKKYFANTAISVNQETPREGTQNKIVQETLPAMNEAQEDSNKEPEG